MFASPCVVPYVKNIFSLHTSNLLPLFEGGFDETARAFVFSLELFFAGKAGQVFGGKDLIAVVQHGIAGHSVGFFGTENAAMVEVSP